jgi:hypothetical protein
MSNQDALRERLDALSRRIEASMRKFAWRGELTANMQTDHDGFITRSASINQKINDAITSGDSWDVIKYELERDFSSLSQDFEQFVKRLDDEQMKR